MLELILGESSCATIQRPHCKRHRCRGSFRRRYWRTRDPRFADEADLGKDFADEELQEVVHGGWRLSNWDPLPFVGHVEGDAVAKVLGRDAGRRPARVRRAPMMCALVVALPGGRARHRSADLTLFRRALYQLSYPTG